MDLNVRYLIFAFLFVLWVSICRYIVFTHTHTLNESSLYLGYINLFLILLKISGNVECRTDRDRPINKQDETYERRKGMTSGSQAVKKKDRDYRDEDEDNEIFEMVIPKNDPTNACIKMNASFHFSVTYQAQDQVEMDIIKRATLSI